MASDLDLTLLERKTKSTSSSKLLLILVIFLLLVGVANLGISLFKFKGGDLVLTPQSLSPDATKTLALKLENQSLKKRAVVVWKEYLSRADLSAKERAKVWYRIGTLHQDKGDYEEALEAYYRSENIAKLIDLELDINRRVQESLESLGKFAALRYELKDRVGFGNNDAQTEEKILAEIGNQKITKSDLDQRIEEQIERSLAALDGVLAEDKIKKQKEALLKQFSTKSERLQFLNQWIMEEILYRKAREDKLAADPAIQKLLKNTEHNILAQQVLQNAITANIHISPADLKSWYDSHPSKYIDSKSKHQKSFKKVRQEVYRDLWSNQQNLIKQSLLSELKSNYDVVIHTSQFQDRITGKPRPVSTERDHIYGNPDAKISLIEYSDFECPFCKKFHLIPKKLVDDFEGKVNWVFRYFPLSSHNPQAQKEAEAAECASEQGGDASFWKYADQIFQRTGTNGRGLPTEKLIPLAEEIGLNREQFKKCLKSERYKDRVLEDFSEGSRIGIRGTPGSVLLSHKTMATVFKSGVVSLDDLKSEINKMLK